MTKLSEVEWYTCIMAIRYAKNRQSILSASLPSMLMEAYCLRWSDHEKETIFRELEDNVIFGDSNIDDPIWKKFRAYLNQNTHYIALLIDKTEKEVFYENNKYYLVKDYENSPSKEIYIPKEYIISLK